MRAGSSMRACPMHWASSRSSRACDARAKPVLPGKPLGRSCSWAGCAFGGQVLRTFALVPGGGGAPAATSSPRRRWPGQGTPVRPAVATPWTLRRRARRRCESGALAVHGDGLDVLAPSQPRVSGERSISSTSTPRSRLGHVAEARLDGPADGRVRRHARVRRPLAQEARRCRRLPRHARAAARGARARCSRRPGRSGCTSTGARRTSCASLLDEILGRDAFVNEIVWRRAPNLGRQAASQQFGRTLDTLVVYGGPARSSSPPTRLEPIDADGDPLGRRGAPVHDGAARRLHRRVDRSASTPRAACTARRAARST